MPQDSRHDRKIDQATRMRAALLRLALGAILVSLAAGLDSNAARAGDDDNSNESFMSKFMKTIGVKPGVNTSAVQYTERSPLVVPPTRDLPPPGSAPAAVSDWPQEPAKHRKATKTGVVPETAVNTPNPAVTKKPWYNPTGWFDKEEYGSFSGEPQRADLTDPPAGYRVPSPDQPYGVGPEKKPKQKKAGDGTEVQQPGK